MLYIHAHTITLTLSSSFPLIPGRASTKQLYKQEIEREIDYMNHTPLLALRLDALAKGTLNESDFPNATDRAPAKRLPSKVSNCLSLTGTCMSVLCISG